jgi:pimeloyl-ACP methyl ester carboxylesterase
LYYELTGGGQPFILLHGSGETHEIFDHLTVRLAKDGYAVYAIDSRGHGRSEKIKNTMSYTDMAEDIAAFIRTLALEGAILYGFSDGGIIGLLLAGKYPNLLSKLIVSGANLSPKGIKGSWAFLFRFIHFFTKDPKLRMMLTEPDIGEDDLGKISIPVLVLAGERDIVKEEETRRIHTGIPNSTLRILDNETHSSYVIHSDKLYGIIEHFL